METRLVNELKCIVYFKDRNLFKDVLGGFDEAKVRVLKVKNEEQYLTQILVFQPQFTMIEIDPLNAKRTFSLIEKHRQLYQDRYPIFLIGNSTDTDLIFQGLEFGAADFFQRPLDFDLIATKIGKYFFNKELQKRDINYTKVPKLMSKTELEISITILSIDEGGILIHSRHTISRGAKLDLGQSQLKELLGVEELIVTVEKIQLNNKKEEVLYATFPEDEVYAIAARKLIMLLKGTEKNILSGVA